MKTGQKKKRITFKTPETLTSTMKYRNENIIPRIPLPKFKTPCKRKLNFPKESIEKFDNFSKKIIMALSDEILDLDNRYIENGLIVFEKSAPSSLISLKINLREKERGNIKGDSKRGKIGNETLELAQDLKKFYKKKIDEFIKLDESNYSTGDDPDCHLNQTLDIPNFDVVEIENIKKFMRENENYDIDDLMKITSPKKKIRSNSESGKSLEDCNFGVEVYKMSLKDKSESEVSSKQDKNFFTITKRDKNYASYVTEKIPKKLEKIDSGKLKDRGEDIDLQPNK